MDKQKLITALKRQRNIKFLAVGLIGFGILLFFTNFLNFFGSFYGDLSMTTAFSGILIIILGTLVLAHSNKILKKEVVEALVFEILLDDIDDLVFTTDRSVDEDDFKEHITFPGYDSFNSNDLISGTYRGHQLEISDLHLTRTQHNGKTTTTVTVFEGKVIKLAMPIKLEAEIKISQSSSLFKKSIALEDVEFNKLFNVESLDEHEVFYLLTPPMMEKIKLFKKTIDGDLYMTFSPNGYLYLAIDNHSNDFELKLNDHDIGEIVARFKNEWQLVKDVLDQIIELF